MSNCGYSYSFISKIKRIELIIDSLAAIENINIEWVHIGDGPLKNIMEVMAANKFQLKKNITWKFVGNKTNTEVLDFYKNNYVDLFINTSSSEGIPVTMMEAQSFGIPILALNVGGVREIVSSENGLLLSSNASALIIAEGIKYILSLPNEKMAAIRKASFMSWQTNYNAAHNFNNFIKSITNLGTHEIK